MGSFSDLAAQFDTVNRKRKGDQFEAVCKWFLENDEAKYKPLLRRVWHWKEWPGRWSDAEAGIDLVAEDHDGRLWAIQAKGYAEKIDREEVNKFLAEASRSIFSYRLLMATTDKLSRIAQRTMEDLGVSFIGLTELEEFQDWPTTLRLRPAKPPKPKEPWPYQNPAIADVVSGFKSADRGQLIMACGTGKTLTAWFIREKLAAERTLVLVPSLSLLKQTMTQWRTANVRTPFDALPVCSDETVGHDEDAAVTHISYLGEPADTDPAKIAAFLQKRSRPSVIFATYHSSPQIAKAFKLGRVPAFDLVIADEAHRIAGAMSSDFATVLDPAAIKAKRRLFMTATPRYFTGRIRRAAKEAEDEIASMDDHTKFGEVFHRLGFSEAIERKILTDYQVAIIGVDDSTHRDWAERGKLLKLNGKATDARSLAGQIGLAKSMRKYDLHRVISFHGRVNRAREFADSMQEVVDWMPARQRPKGPLWSKHVSGNMSAGQRHKLLQQLKRLDDGERIGLLANARCLAEGVDVPALDGVAFIDPRRSEADIVQAVGRAIRKSDAKTVGTIIIPVFIDTKADPEVVLEDSVFKPVWDVIKALRAHDDELGRQLDELRREMGRNGGKPKLPEKIYVDMPANVSTDFADAFDTRLVENSTASWEFWIGLLNAYAQEHGHARVPKHYEVDGFRLGQWTGVQRGVFAKGSFDPDRRRRLEELPGWTWNALDDSWEEGYARLLAHVGEHGNARVPKLYTVDAFRLGNWMERQRYMFAKGSLDADRQRRLEALPGWSWSPHTDDWEQGYARLVTYVGDHKNARVPRHYEVDGFRLGQWTGVQRGVFAKGSFDPDRRRRLEELPGWSWDPYADGWEEGYARLVTYVSDHGTARVPQPYRTPDGFRLGSWTNRQRGAFSKGVLDTDLQRRLEELPGWTWSARADSWEEKYERLTAYVATHSDARVTYSYTVDGFRLGQWVAGQRSAYASGDLPSDRKERLEALRGWVWDAYTEDWEGGFAHMQDYAKHFGDCLVQAKYISPDGFRLGGWVNTQRTAFAKGNFDADRRRRLESLPGWTWNPNAKKWEEGYARLVSYVAKHGDSRVPYSYQVDGYRLGSWVGTQRAAFAKGALSAERQQRLESQPGWTWNVQSEI